MLPSIIGNSLLPVWAMASNFILNNEITYRAYRYRGPSLFLGFIAFALGCGVGAIANIDVASWLYKAKQTWWVAGLAGALLSVVWNYAVSTKSHLATGSSTLPRPARPLA